MSYPKIINWCYMNCSPDKITWWRSWEGRYNTTNDKIYNPMTGGYHAFYSGPGNVENNDIRDTWIKVQLRDIDFKGQVKNLRLTIKVQTSTKDTDYILTVAQEQKDFLPAGSNYLTTMPPYIKYNDETLKYDIFLGGTQTKVNNEKILAQAQVNSMQTGNTDITFELPTFKTNSNIIYLNLKSSKNAIFFDENQKEWAFSTEEDSENPLIINTQSTITYYSTITGNSENTLWKEQIKEYQQSNFNLLTEIPEYTGFHFVEWNTKSDGSGTIYKKGQAYDKDEDLTLYAIWTKQYTTTNITNLITEKIYEGNNIRSQSGNDCFHFTFSPSPRSEEYYVLGDEITFTAKAGYVFKNNGLTTFTTYLSQMTIELNANYVEIIYTGIESSSNTNRYYYGQEEPLILLSLPTCNNKITINGQLVSPSKYNGWYSLDHRTIIPTENKDYQQQHFFFGNSTNSKQITVFPYLQDIPISVTSNQIFQPDTLTETLTENGTTTTIAKEFTFGFIDEKNNKWKLSFYCDSINSIFTLTVKDITSYNVIINGVTYTYQGNSNVPKDQSGKQITSGYYTMVKNGAFAQFFIPESGQFYLKCFNLELYPYKTIKTLYLWNDQFYTISDQLSIKGG